MQKIKVVNRSVYPLPEYKTIASSGLDLQANIKEDILLQPLERVLVPTGLFVELPIGYEFQIRPRSGHSLKTGVTAILGTIDADYRGEIGVIIANISSATQTIKVGERVAQMVLQKVEQVEFEKCLRLDELSETERGAGGFGSTGK